jgi:PAS domain S-box-containing protein
MNDITERIGKAGIVEINRDLVIDYIDRSLHYYFKRPEQLIGTKVTAVPEFIDSNLSIIINELAKGKSIRKRIELKGEDGKKDVLLEAEPLMDRSGTFRRAVILLQEVTQLIEKWNTYNLSLLSYKNITDAIPSGIIVTDTDGWIWFSNPVATKMLGKGSGRKRKVPETLKIPAGTSREIFYTSPEKGTFFLDVNVMKTKWFGNPAQLYVLHDITELRKSEDQNMLLLAAMQSAGNGIAIVRQDFSLEWVNHAFAELTGWRMEEAVDCNIMNLMNGTGMKELFNDKTEDVVSGMRTYRKACRWTRKDGSYLDCDLTITPFTEKITGKKRYILVFNDLTQLKELENMITILNKVFVALQKANSLEDSFVIFRDELLKNKIQSVIYLLDEDEKVLTPHLFSFDTKFLKKFDDMTGMRLESLSIPVGLSGKYEQILKHKRTVFSHDVAGDLLRVMPSLRAEFVRNQISSLGIQHSISAPIRDKEGNVFAIFQLLSDKLSEWNVPEVIAFSNHLSFFFQKIQLLEELKENYNKLRHSYVELRTREEQYRNFFDYDLTGDYIITPDGKFLDCNQAFIDIFGFGSKEEVLASNATDRHPSRNAHEKILKIIQSEKRLVNLEEELVRKDGRKIQVLINAFGRFDDQGQLVQIIGYIFDITKLRKYEAELISAKEKAEESDRLKSAFLANISHEIRTPINAIVGFASLMAEENLPAPMRDEYSKIIKDNIYQLLGLLDDIIKMARIESGEVEVHYESLDVHRLLTDVYKTFLLHPLLKEKNITLSLDVGHTGEKIITGDSVKIREILENLITNAVKFTEKGSINFGYRHLDEETLIFYVRDTGVGITKGQQKEIFERFRQADNKLTRKYEGAGLGLAICKSYVERMGGEIWVESTHGRGSTFYFSMPLKPSEEKSDQ